MDKNNLAYTIIIVSYKSNNYTIACLKSILNLQNAQIRVVVVENSGDELLRSDLYSRIRSLGLECVRDDYSSNPNAMVFLLKQINLGFASANNLGILFSKSNFKTDWFWLLNNDTEVNKDVICKISDCVHNKNFDKKTGIIGHDIFYLNNRSSLQGIGGHFNWLTIGGGDVKPKRYNKEECKSVFNKKVDYIIGASMFISNEFIDEVGLMNEIYFLYYEEMDWIIRGKKLGFNLGYCHGAIVYHAEGASIGSGSTFKTKSPIAEFYGLRSKMLFIKQHVPMLIPYLFFIVLIGMFLRFSSGKIKEGLKSLRMFYDIFFSGKIPVYS